MTKYTSNIRVALLLVLFTLFSGAIHVVTAQTAGPLGPYEWKNRPLLIFAPSVNDATYREQNRHVEAERAGFRERDMVLLEIFAEGESRAAGESLDAVAADVLRKRFGVGEDEFAAILVGKDSTEKERWAEPAEMEEVFRLIDGMPMRQREMRSPEE